MVYEDSDHMLTHVLDRCSALSSSLMSILTSERPPSGSSGDASLAYSTSSGQSLYVFNPTSFDRLHALNDGNRRNVIRVNAFSFTAVEDSLPISKHPMFLTAIADSQDSSSHNPATVTVIKSKNDKVNDTKKESSVNPCTVRDNSDGTYTLENECVSVRVSSSGGVLSLRDLRTNPPREVIDRTDGGFGNRLMLYDDVPFFWDAWDTFPYHIHTGGPINGIAVPSDAQGAKAASSGVNVVSLHTSDGGLTSSLIFELSGWGGRSRNVNPPHTGSQDNPLILLPSRRHVKLLLLADYFFLLKSNLLLPPPFVLLCKHLLSGYPIHVLLVLDEHRCMEVLIDQQPLLPMQYLLLQHQPSILHQDIH